MRPEANIGLPQPPAAVVASLPRPLSLSRDMAVPGVGGGGAVVLGVPQAELLPSVDGSTDSMLPSE